MTEEERIRHDERKRMIAQGCVHTSKASERIETRPDLKRWQEAQSEYFNQTILEIVSEYAAWRDGENLERLRYEGDVMEAVQRLIERGRATLDVEGYLVSLPSSPSVTKAVVRDMAGETVCGFRVAAYREKHPVHGDKYGHTYSEHWSTPSAGANVERLFTESQLIEALSWSLEEKENG